MENSYKYFLVFIIIIIWLIINSRKNKLKEKEEKIYFEAARENKLKTNRMYRQELEDYENGLMTFM
jgi:hypothetical protein